LDSAWATAAEEGATPHTDTHHQKVLAGLKDQHQYKNLTQQDIQDVIAGYAPKLE
jgi:hypothetical protein